MVISRVRPTAPARNVVLPAADRGHGKYQIEFASSRQAESGRGPKKLCYPRGLRVWEIWSLTAKSMSDDASAARFWVGFDLGGTKMLATVFDDKFNIRARKRRKTKGGDAGQDSGVDRLVQTIDQALEEADLTRDQLAGIGIGCPSPVDMRRGIVLNAVNLNWRNVRLKEALQKAFPCTVAVLNDVDAGVYAENRFGAARSARTVLGVFPGTGIGGGCVYEGRIVRGKGSSCMEIGHVQVRRNGNLCGCGLRGCLETEASRLAISAEVAKAAFRGEAPHLLAAAGTNLADIRSGVLAQAINDGDKVVERIVRQAAETIGIAVANFVHLLSPDCIVLGGGLVEAMPDLFVDSVHRAARAHVMPSFADSFKTVAAELGDDATVMGAAAWVEANSAGEMT